MTSTLPKAGYCVCYVFLVLWLAFNSYSSSDYDMYLNT